MKMKMVSINKYLAGAKAVGNLKLSTEFLDYGIYLMGPLQKGNSV